MHFQDRNSSAPSENDEASEEDHLHDDTSKGGAGPSMGGKGARRGGKMSSAAAEVCMHARHVHACLPCACMPTRMPCHLQMPARSKACILSIRATCTLHSCVSLRGVVTFQESHIDMH